MMGIALENHFPFRDIRANVSMRSMK